MGPKFTSVLQELFVEMIAKDALVYAQQGKRKTLQRKDLGELCYEDLKMDILNTEASGVKLGLIVTV